MKDVKKIIATLKKEGAVSVKATVKNAVVTKDTNDEGKDYLRIALTLDKDVPNYVLTGDEYKEGTSRFAYILSGSLGHFLSEDERTAFIKDDVCSNPIWCKAILVYSTVEILCQKVKAKEKYINPFSENGEEHEVENDNIYHHLIGFELGSMATKYADRFTEDVLFGKKED